MPAPRSRIPSRLLSHTALTGLALSFALAAPQSARAQQVYDLAAITLFSNFVPSAIQRSGASVSVVTRDEIEASGISQVADVLNRLPGVTMAQSGGAGGPAQVRIRGASPRHVAVYMDGVRVDDPTGISTEFDFGLMATDDIERIEVLRGTQSALYGSSAVGGVVNLTTRAPSRDGFSQELAAEAGSNDTYGLRYTLGFRDERFESVLTLSHRRSRGVSAWEGPLPVAPGLERDGFETSRLSLSMRYQASEALAYGFSLFAQDSMLDYDGYGDPSGDYTASRDERGGRVFAEYDTGAVRHELSLTRYDITRRYFLSGAPNGWFQGDRTVLGYQGTSEVRPGLTLIWGADTAQESAEFGASLTGREAIRTSGLFGQALWSPVEGLDISATARVDRNSDFGDFLSGRLTAAWQATDTIVLRGAIARGFTAPSVNQRYGAIYPFYNIAPNPALTPETSLSYEIGADVTLGSATIGATLFQLDTDNAIEWCGAWAPACGFVLPVGFDNAYQNVPGATRRRGLELAASMPLNERLTLSGAYTYMHAKDPTGARLVRVPRHDLTLTLDADVTERLRASVSAQHVAGLPDETDWTGWPAVPVAMADYTVVNANFRYALTANADVILRIDNLFDREYQQVWGYSAPDRSFYLGVAARF